MPDPAQAVFLVNAETDPVQVRVEGKACFANSAPLGEFLNSCIQQGKRQFLIDFQNCPSVDSTFLGVIAGAGLALKRAKPTGRVTLSRLNGRNLETMRNLGITRLCQVCEEVKATDAAQALSPEKKTELDQAKLVLKAHEMLVAADEANAAKFQDVLTFMRERVAKG